MIIHPRIAQWQSRLDKVICTMMASPLKYSVNDCMLLAVRAIRAMTGQNILDSPAVKKYAPDGIPFYGTKEEAEDVLWDFGFTSISELLDATLSRKNILFIQPGDIVQHPKYSDIVGVMGGEFIHFLSLTDKPSLLEAYSFEAKAWDVLLWVE